MGYKIIEDKVKCDTLLKRFLKKKKIKPMNLADNAKLSKSQISNIVSGLQPDMYINTAKKICNALDCDFDDVFGEGKITTKTKILDIITEEESKLHDEDASGHIWWNRFRELIDNRV
jgi:DNA-binding Xre family transcriptional regulator